jgi:hypothetical protein
MNRSSKPSIKRATLYKCRSSMQERYRHELLGTFFPATFFSENLQQSKLSYQANEVNITLMYADILRSVFSGGRWICW